MTQKPKESGSAQYQKFLELARKLETVDSEEPLNAAIRQVAKSPPPKDHKPAKDE